MVAAFDRDPSVQMHNTEIAPTFLNVDSVPEDTTHAIKERRQILRNRSRSKQQTSWHYIQ
jgi:hypothetical protein